MVVTIGAGGLKSVPSPSQAFQATTSSISKSTSTTTSSSSKSSSSKSGGFSAATMAQLNASKSSTITNPLSPTGYSDVLNQPVSVAPKSPFVSQPVTTASTGSGTKSYTIQNVLSPTGYSDVLNQPVSVAPKATTLSPFINQAQAAYDAQMALVRSNVQTQRDALQQDNNYVLSKEKQPHKENVISVNYGKATPSSALVSKWEATKYFFGTLGSDIKTVVTGKMDINKPGWNLENPFIGYEYSSETLATKEVKNPFYLGPQKVTKNIYDIGQKQRITLGELSESGKYISLTPTDTGLQITNLFPYDLGKRQFSSEKALKITGSIGEVGLAIGTAGVSVLPISFARATPILGKGFIGEDLSLKERAKLIGIGTLDIAAGTMGGVQTFKIQSAQLRGLSQETILSKANKLPYIGTETRGEKLTTQIFGKAVKTGSGKFESIGTNIMATKDKAFSGLGRVSNRLEIIDYYTGKSYVIAGEKVFTSKGLIIDTGKEFTPAITQIKSIDTFSLNKVGSNIKIDLFPRGFTPTTEYIGGRARDIKGYALSESGKFGGFNIRKDVLGPLEDMRFDIKTSKSFSFKPQTRAMLKIVTPDESGGGVITIQQGTKTTKDTLSSASQLKSFGLTLPKSDLSIPKSTIKEITKYSTNTPNIVSSTIKSSFDSSLYPPIVGGTGVSEYTYRTKTYSMASTIIEENQFIPPITKGRISSGLTISKMENYQYIKQDNFLPKSVILPRSEIGLLSKSDYRYRLKGMEYYSKTVSLPKSDLGLFSGTAQDYTSIRDYSYASSIGSGIGTPSLGGSWWEMPNIKPPKFGLPELPSLGGWAEPKGKGIGKKAGFNIAPSFTGIITGFKIKAPLKVSKSLGVTPFQVRGLLASAKGKPLKGPYYKLY